MVLIFVLGACVSLTATEPTGQSATPALMTPTTAELPPSVPESALKPPGRLVSRLVAKGPTLDGQIDEVWEHTSPLDVGLTWGIHGREHALDVRLRSVYEGDTVYFLAEWPGGLPPNPPDTISNRFTMHFDTPEPNQTARDAGCHIACHTAFANDSGRFVYMSADTIPPGQTGPLPVGGGWSDGTWRLEWAQPMRAANPLDVRFVDLAAAYPFFAKVFEGVERRADPVSGPCVLVFEH